MNSGVVFVLDSPTAPRSLKDRKRLKNNLSTSFEPEDCVTVEITRSIEII